jgi:HEAT repeat protein
LEDLALAFQDKDAFKRRVALEAIGRLGAWESAEPLVLAGLEDESGYVKRTACEVAERWQLASARLHLLALLRNPEMSTVVAALHALQTLGKEQDVQAVTAVFGAAKHEDIRRAAGWTMRQLAGQQTWRSIFELFVVDPLPRHRLFACDLAEHFGAREVEQPLSMLAKDHDGHVRSAAQRALNGPTA